MRIMAVDYGDAHTGVALSDPTGFLAGTTTTIHSRKTEVVLEELSKLVREYQVEELVMGFPKNMDGSVGPRAELCQKFAKALNALIPLPVELWDERQTTMQAEAYLNEVDVRGQKRKDIIDEVAATIILESYLQYRKNQKKE